MQFGPNWYKNDSAIDLTGTDGLQVLPMRHGTGLGKSTATSKGLREFLCGRKSEYSALQLPVATRTSDAEAIQERRRETHFDSG